MVHPQYLPKVQTHNEDEGAHPSLIRGDDIRLTNARAPIEHTHDDRYFTRTEASAQFLEFADDAVVANLVITGEEIIITESVPTVINLDADLLDTQEGSYYLDRANHSGTQDVTTISGVMARVQLPTSVAYEDEVNTYTARQRIIANSAVSTLLDLLLIAGSSNSVVGGGYPSIMVVNRNLVGPSLSRFTFNVGDGTLLGSFLADLNAQGTGTDFYSAGFDERAMGISIYSAHPFIVKTGNVTRLKVPGTAPAADQAALLLQVNAGGTTSVRQVTVGAVDSGGAGFRLLRVPN